MIDNLRFIWAEPTCGVFTFTLCPSHLTCSPLYLLATLHAHHSTQHPTHSPNYVLSYLLFRLLTSPALVCTFYRCDCSMGRYKEGFRLDYISLARSAPRHCHTVTLGCMHLMKGRKKEQKTQKTHQPPCFRACFKTMLHATRSNTRYSLHVLLHDMLIQAS